MNVFAARAAELAEARPELAAAVEPATVCAGAIPQAGFHLQNRPAVPL
jgi:hypothetical protein